MWMQRQSLSTIAAAPFVKWAGGKTQLLHRLDVLVPNFTKYFEPFLGGGALLFHLPSKRGFKAHLSDANNDLVGAYNIVKNDVDSLISKLVKYEKQYRNSPEEYYYKLRAQRPDKEVEAAARFITLNKTCYNGLYRV